MTLQLFGWTWPNAFGAVPHRLIKFVLEFFHVPEEVRIVAAYYSCFKMRFTAAAFKTNWQDLQVVIPNWLEYLTHLFVLAMKVIIRMAKCQGVAVQVASGQELPPIRTFILHVPSINDAEAILCRLSGLPN